MRDVQWTLEAEPEEYCQTCRLPLTVSCLVQDEALLEGNPPLGKRDSEPAVERYEQRNITPKKRNRSKGESIQRGAASKDFNLSAPLLTRKVNMQQLWHFQHATHATASTISKAATWASRPASIRYAPKRALPGGGWTELWGELITKPHLGSLSKLF